MRGGDSVGGGADNSSHWSREYIEWVNEEMVSPHLTLKGFDAAVDVLVLFESGARGKGFPALWAGVTARPDMGRPDVAL